MVTAKTKAESWRMFDAIAPRYDGLNHLLSLGWDIHWRRVMADHWPADAHHVLDLATGTGDVLFTLLKRHAHIHEAVGVDLSEAMLAKARAKARAQRFVAKVSFEKADAMALPFPENRFDGVTLAFGIRNMPHPIQCLMEIHRVLKPGGTVLILEFSLPAHPIWRACHLIYLRTVVPVIGGLLSGHFQAYRYLNQTIETFPYGPMFCRLLAQTGFDSIRLHPLLGGIATLYSARKRTLTHDSSEFSDSPQ